MANGGGVGGLKAGTGTAGLGASPTRRLKTTKDETVDAKIGNHGASTISTRDPQDRQEGSARSRRDIAIEFLKVQEEALASEPLPLSRREHVLRYFTALRKQLESGNK